MTSFSCYSLGAATVLFGSLHSAHTSVSRLLLKAVGLDSDSCMTDTVLNSNEIHYITCLMVKIPFMDIEIR